MMKKEFELLAPAGSFEILKAVIEAGADAVYCAGKFFGARSYAGNFSNEEIIEAAEYVHLRFKKIYITVNTLIFESEFTADKNTTTVIGKLPIDYSEHKMLIIKWIANGEEGFNHYVTGFIPYDLEKYKAWIEKYNLRS